MSVDKIRILFLMGAESTSFDTVLNKIDEL